MPVEERSRQRLYTRLGEVLGEEHAMTLMAQLPPTGWNDVVRHDDLETFKQRVDARFDAVDARFDAVDARFDAVDARIGEAVNGVKAELLTAMITQTRTFVFATVGALATLAGVVFAAG